MTPQTRMSPRAWALMGTLALLWGGSFAATAVVLTEIHFFTAVALRVSIAAAILWVVVLALRYPLPRDLRSWGLLLALGLFGTALPFSLITWGQMTVPSGLAAILNASTAVFSVLIAALLFRDERLTPRKVVGAGLGVLGVSTAIGLQAIRNLDLTSLGQLALVAASVCYALTGALGRVALRGVAPQVVATGMLTGSALVMLPVALWMDGLPDPTHSAQVWIALAYSAVMATAVAYLVFYQLLAIAGAGNSGLTTLLVAPVAIVMGAILLSEALPLRAYLGFALLAAGLLVVDGRILLLWRGPGQVASHRP